MKSEGSSAAVGDRDELPRLNQEGDTERPLPGDDAYGGKTVMRAVPSEILRAARQTREAKAGPRKVIVQTGDDHVPAPPQVPAELRSPIDDLLEELETEVAFTAATATPDEVASQVAIRRVAEAAQASGAADAAPPKPTVIVNTEEVVTPTPGALAALAGTPAAASPVAVAPAQPPAPAATPAVAQASAEARIPTLPRALSSASQADQVRGFSAANAKARAALWVLALVAISLLAYLLAR